MRIVDLIMRFETHSKNARDGAEKDVSDYFVYNTLAMLKNAEKFIERVKEAQK